MTKGHLLSITFGQGDENPKMEPLIQSFHSAKITGMDVCVRKALLATCSWDKSVKVWNYLEHTLECSKEFDESATALAFHPSGLLLVVAFEESIRIMNIYEQDFVVIKEIPIKMCKEIKFANGGHLFAIANHAVVQVFQTYTGDNPPQYVFRGHSTKVKSIQWQEDDLGFYTIS